MCNKLGPKRSLYRTFKLYTYAELSFMVNHCILVDVQLHCTIRDVNCKMYIHFLSPHLSYTYKGSRLSSY